MDLEKWTVLLRALDRGSLSAAAEELGYTPSGVSRAVAALAEELGVPLLARLHRGVAPTRECQALLPMAREMVHLSSLLAQRSDELRGLVSGSLSVGTAYHHLSLIHICWQKTAARITRARPRAPPAASSAREGFLWGGWAARYWAVSSSTC